MTVIKPEDANILSLGDVYSVGNYGPYMIVKNTPRIDRMLGTNSNVCRKDVAALSLKHPDNRRHAGHVCRVGMAHDDGDKIRAEEVSLEPAGMTLLNDVPPGVFFMARLLGHSEERIFVKDEHGHIFRSDGIDVADLLAPPFFVSHSEVETFEVVTDIKVEERVT